MEISREWYTFITSSLHIHVLRMILDLKRPSFCNETIVYILNQVVPKMAFVLVSEVRLTRYYGNLKPYFWYQSVALVPRKCKIVSILSQLDRFRVKQKTKSPYSLYRRSLAAVQHHTMPPASAANLRTSRCLATQKSLLRLFLRFL